MKLFGCFERIDERTGDMTGHYFEFGADQFKFKFCPFCGKPIPKDNSIHSDRGL